MKIRLKTIKEIRKIDPKFRGIGENYMKHLSGRVFKTHKSMQVYEIVQTHTQPWFIPPEFVAEVIEED